MRKIFYALFYKTLICLLILAMVIPSSEAFCSTIESIASDVTTAEPEKMNHTDFEDSKENDTQSDDDGESLEYVQSFYDNNGTLNICINACLIDRVSESKEPVISRGVKISKDGKDLKSRNFEVEKVSGSDVDGGFTNSDSNIDSTIISYGDDVSKKEATDELAKTSIGILAKYGGQTKNIF